MLRGTPGLHPALTDQQDGRDVGLCMRCGGELYPGEMGYMWEDRQICPDCFKRVVTVWLEESSREVAAALGVEMRVL
ncbi:MAG: hypothetical protein IKB79_00545 [Oscillospiraceae bacterium]|nr:hypothetical protein [Oscillospiraceae bacterium]